MIRCLIDLWSQMVGNINRNISHCRQSFIFFPQFSWYLPWQNVPLINQQKYPALYSQAVQFSLHSTGQLRISQQGPVLSSDDLLRDRRNNNCRSALAGMFLHPCSKLCIALGDTHSRRASSPWVFLKEYRTCENSFLSIECPLYLFTSIIPRCGIILVFNFRSALG